MLYLLALHASKVVAQAYSPALLELRHFNKDFGRVPIDLTKSITTASNRGGRACLLVVALTGSVCSLFQRFWIFANPGNLSGYNSHLHTASMMIGDRDLLHSSTASAPLALGASAFAAGILMSSHLQRPPLICGLGAVLLALCALLAVFKANAHLARFTVVLSFVAAGAFAQTYTITAAPMIASAEFLQGKPVVITGHVTNDGALLAGGGPRERFDLQSEALRFAEDGSAAQAFTKPVGIRVTIFSRNKNPEADDDDSASVAQRLPDLHYGQRVELVAKLRPPRNFRNPGAFDYEAYLRGLGITALASVEAKSIRIVPGAGGSRLAHLRSSIRRSILEHITGARSPWEDADGAIFSAMVIGDDSQLLRNVREEFQQTGVYHLLVVSGMNVGLLAFAVFWLARQLRAPDWLACLVTIVLAVFYASIAGMGVPIQRAVLMLSLLLIARLFYRGRAPLNSTGFAALVVLVLTPHAIFEAGFQLTFLALLAIFGISLPILERTAEPYRRALRHLESTSYDLSLEPKFAQLRLDLRLVVGRLARLIGATPARWLLTGMMIATVASFELVLVSAITQAVLVIPMRAYFHRAAIIGMPGNILVLPIAGVLLNSAVAAIAVSYVSMPLARVPAELASACLHWTLSWLHWLSRFHISQWRVPDPNVALWVIAAAGVMLALLAARRKPAIFCAGSAALFITAAIAAFANPSARLHAGDLEITTIDVGQGDSIVVISPEGKTMLIDAGGSIGPVRSEFDSGEDIVSPYLWARGIRQIDVIALTHAHGDHIGGLPRIIENFHPKELWIGINPETPALHQLIALAHQYGLAIRKHTAGDRFIWGGTNIRVLSPSADWKPKARPTNDDSLAVLISYGSTSALLAGDLEKKTERIVATESPRADVLKIDHHGSATSTTPEFLRAVSPRYAVISVGYRNSFGHPRSEVLTRLQKAHVQTWRTDFHGAVTFLLDGKYVSVHTFSGF